LRVVVNAPCSQGAAGFGTHLAPSFTIGTGFFGRSSVGENIGPQHLVNWTRIAYSDESSEPFGDFAGLETESDRPPLAVLGKLILLSILIGVVLSALGLDPLNIFSSLQRLIRDVWNMGFDAVRWLWQYFLLGAVIVIPIWLILRLVRAPKGR